MATRLGAKLVPDLQDRLSGANLDRSAGKAILLLTVDAEGWPHPAMLSYCEVAAKDAQNVRLAVYSSSTTTANVRENGKLTAVIVDERVAYYIKGTGSVLAPAMTAARENAKLNLRVEHVLADHPDPRFERDAYISSGITYRNPDRASALDRAHRVLAELLA
jgi:hypothetical protein